MSDHEHKPEDETKANAPETKNIEEQEATEGQEDNFAPADLSGEVPDPIFDDTMPLKPSSEFMPDPVFETDQPQNNKRRLSPSELGELASSIPEEIRRNDLNATSQPSSVSADTVPLPDNIDDILPRGSETQNATDDLADMPLIIEDDPEIETIQKERDKAHSPDPFLEGAPLPPSTDGLNILPEETENPPVPEEDYSYEAMDEFAAEDADIETDILHEGEDSLLSEKDPTLKKITVACGWDMSAYDGEALDLDLSCFLLNNEGLTRVDSDFVFYNNPKGADLAVIHSGDNRTGAGEGDDETISIDLEALPYEISKIVFTVTIYEGEENNASFGGVQNAYIRLLNSNSKAVLARFDLSNDFAEGTAIRFGYMERIGSSWTFHAEGNVETGGLAKIAESYGLLIAGT